MRSLIFLLLLGGASVPALSQDRDRSGDERPMRAERSERADRPSRAERMEARSQAREERREQRTMRVERQSVESQAVAQQSVPQQSVETAAQSGVAERRPSAYGRQRQGYDIAPRQREVRTIPNTSTVATPQTGITTQHRSRDRDGRRWSGDHRRWDRESWRGDRRYDWRRWRDRNRSTFRLGLYVDPFGWGYNRWGIGSRLYPNYYRSSFWINDPWQYRLPQAYPPYRWVRYHNDAILVDTWSGEVVDVIYNFFW